MECSRFHNQYEALPQLKCCQAQHPRPDALDFQLSACFLFSLIYEGKIRQ